MKRRNFLASLPLAGLTMGNSAAFMESSSVRAPNDSPSSTMSTMQKVKLAMLGEEFALSDAASPGGRPVGREENGRSSFDERLQKAAGIRTGQGPQDKRWNHLS